MLFVRRRRVILLRCRVLLRWWGGTLRLGRTLRLRRTLGLGPRLRTRRLRLALRLGLALWGPNIPRRLVAARRLVFVLRLRLCPLRKTGAGLLRGYRMKVLGCAALGRRSVSWLRLRGALLLLAALDLLVALQRFEPGLRARDRLNRIVLRFGSVALGLSRALRLGRTLGLAVAGSRTAKTAANHGGRWLNAANGGDNLRPRRDSRNALVGAEELLAILGRAALEGELGGHGRRALLVQYG
jgi:hypothetical protein